MASPDWMLSVVIAVAVILCVLFIILAVVIIYCMYCRRRRDPSNREKIQQYINETGSVSSLSSLDEGKSRASHVTWGHQVTGGGYLKKNRTARSMPERRTVQYQPPWMRRNGNGNMPWRFRAKNMFSRNDHTTKRTMSEPNTQSLDARSLKLRLTGQNYQSQNRADFNFYQTYPPVLTSDNGPANISNNGPTYIPHSPKHHQNIFGDSVNTMNQNGVLITTVKTPEVNYEYDGQPYTSSINTPEVNYDYDGEPYSSGTNPVQMDSIISSSLKSSNQAQAGDTWAVIGPVLTSNKVVSTSDSYDNPTSVIQVADGASILS